MIASAEASSNLARYDGIQYGPCITHRTHSVCLTFEFSNSPTGSRHGLPTGKMPSSVAISYAETRSKTFGDEVIRRILLGSYALTAE